MAKNTNKSNIKLTPAAIAAKYSEGLLKANPDLTAKSEEKLLKKLSRGQVKLLTPSQEARGITVWLKDQSKALATYVDREMHEICEVDLADLFVGRQVNMVSGAAALPGVQIAGASVNQRPSQVAGQAAMSQAQKGAKAQPKTFGRSNRVVGSAASTAAAVSPAVQEALCAPDVRFTEDDLRWLLIAQMASDNPGAKVTPECYRSMKLPTFTADGSKWTVTATNDIMMGWEFTNQNGVKVVLTQLDMIAGRAVRSELKKALDRLSQ